uniref:Flavin-containing monooxygenase n=1 Tax=Bursaphelenchus xylophilus TaxID=6326 RepID=A0A1I7SRM3_BURXY
MAKEKVAIIGAGPSGLTAARQALEAGFEPVVLERRNRFGGRWSFTEDKKYITHLPSTRTKYSKISSSFSDFPISDHFPQFLSQPEVLEYLENYVEKFDLKKFIKLETNVVGIRRHKKYDDNGIFVVDYEKSGQRYSEEFPYVLLALGRTHKPWRPNPYRKEKEFKGKISHSAEYKGNSAFEGQKVVIVGFGDSAVEIANDLSFVAKKVIICARHGEWLNYRADPSGHPLDHEFNSRFMGNLRKIVPKPVFNKIWEKYSLSQLNLEQHGVERPTFGYWNTIPTFADGLKEHLKSGKIRFEKDFLSFDEKSVEFSDRKAENNVDHVIFCTGYEFDFSLLENGTMIRVRDNDSQLYLHMFDPEISRGNLAIIGLANPFGPNWPIAELQVGSTYRASTPSATLRF